MSFNNTTSSDRPTSCPYNNMPRTTEEILAKRISFWAVVIVGILSNTLVIVVAGRFKVRKNLHHLIINMAVSDILFLVAKTYDYSSNLTGLSLTDVTPSGVLGDIICKLKSILLDVTFRVSLITLFVISIERYKATRRTAQRSRPYTLTKRIAVIAACWLIPIAFFSPYLGIAKVEYFGDVWYCQIIPEDYTRYVYFPNVIIASLTFLVLFSSIVLSLLTIRRLYAINKGNDDLLTKQSQERRAKKIRAAVRMVVASLVLYTVCWFPKLLWGVLTDVDNINNFFGREKFINLNSWCIDRRSFTFVRELLFPLFNSSFSPFIYVIFLADFREAFFKLLCCRKEKFEIKPLMTLQPLT